MEKFVIRGGTPLYGKIKIESAKNAVLPMMAASVLTKEQTVIKNCPMINDVLNMARILEYLGVKTEFKDGNLIIDAREVTKSEVPESLMKELRSSIFMMGALLGRTKRCEVPSPGGCKIGNRPINFHIDGLKKIGVKVTEKEGCTVCTCQRKRGGTVDLPYPSVGATENLILASVTEDGTTVIYNVAREPEIVDLCDFLNCMGAKIKGAGTGKITIEGVNKLYGTEYQPISDRIETGTFLFATLICGGKVELENADEKNIYSLLEKVCNNTCKTASNNGIIYLQSGIVGNGFDLITGPFPSFATDLQAQALALATVSRGNSCIRETVFSNRFNHVEWLLKMGADITVQSGIAEIRGVKKLHGETVYAGDLRGGAALCLAALGAEGESTVYGVNHIDRGYLAFDGKLKCLGADIERVF